MGILIPTLQSSFKVEVRKPWTESTHTIKDNDHSYNMANSVYYIAITTIGFAFC